MTMLPPADIIVRGGSTCCSGVHPNPLDKKVHDIYKITDSELDYYESEGKAGHGFYSEDMYYGEDGQHFWFNAGVRVGVGIGLGMCVGVGIGVGLLMRSYQATTTNLRRRFF